MESVKIEVVDSSTTEAVPVSKEVKDFAGQIAAGNQGRRAEDIKTTPISETLVYGGSVVTKNELASILNSQERQ